MGSPVVSVVRQIPLHTGTGVPFPIAFPNVHEALDKGGNGVLRDAIFASVDGRSE